MTGATAKKPRTKSADVRRGELMDAAERLFLEKGFSATSVSEIVEGADVAKGTFYLYFKTKDDVLTALRFRFVEDFCERLDAAMAHNFESWAARLDAWATTCVAAYLDKIALHDLVFEPYSAVTREMKANNLVIIRLTTLLEDGVRAKAWSLEQPVLTAAMLFYAMHGAVDVNLAAEKPLDRAALTETIRTFYRQALQLCPT